MKIALIEPFFVGSHAQWALGYKKCSKHEVEIFSLKGKYWKWRMYGGAVQLAKELLDSSFKPDLILASDMLDLSRFLGLIRPGYAAIPTALYFHENQLSYPWSPEDPDVVLERHNQYAFINYSSALAADAIFFNSSFHKSSFLQALPTFLNQFPDYKGLDNVERINKKSQVLPLGIDLMRLDILDKLSKPVEPIILWNHRWEYDKNPELFFELLFQLKQEGIPFKLIVLGKSYARKPAYFEQAKIDLSEEILHFGYTEQADQYAKFLHQSDILPVTSKQDFFGASVVEAIYCNCFPILPNRLAYPEHIPKAAQGVHLYNKEEELYDKLKAAVLNIQDLRVNRNYSNFVADYDWRKLGPRYDTAFQQIKL